MTSPSVARPVFASLFIGAALFGGACDSDSNPSRPELLGPLTCDLADEFLVSGGVGRDGIPTLENPEFISADPSIGNAYLNESDRVVGVVLDGEPLAVPLNILWYHEIVNLDRGSERIAVTYCPLTGSSMGFDRSSLGGDELGISGLLFMNNLIMYNRGDPESLFPQMIGEARCGAEPGRVIARYPVFEMTWRAWRELYPETKVITSDVNISRDYTTNPYGSFYESLANDAFLFPNMPRLDARRPAKERVLGLPPGDGDAGVAFPFGALEDAPSSWTVVPTSWRGSPVVVFWSDQFQGAGAFRPLHPGTGAALDFRVAADGGIEDAETGTKWSIAGVGIEGPLAGTSLEPVAEAYVAFWGAWAAFHPSTELWEGP